MTESSIQTNLLCGTDCRHPKGDILISNDIARCAKCPFERIICDAKKASQNDKHTVLIKRARFPASYWRKLFIAEAGERKRAKAMIEHLGHEIAELQTQLSNLKGGE